MPPGASKWKKIEPRLFSAIRMNRRARPLLSHELVVSLIGATTTGTGLRIRCELDATQYATGKSVPDREDEGSEARAPRRRPSHLDLHHPSPCECGSSAKDLGPQNGRWLDIYRLLNAGLVALPR